MLKMITERKGNNVNADDITTGFKDIVTTS